MLHKLQLTHFRNYEDRVFTFSPQLTIITGANTAGKTSILEAIMLLSSGRSFRADREREMISIGFEVARSKIQLAQENGTPSDVLEAIITAGVVQGKKAPFKIFKLNGNNKRQISIVGMVPAVLFWPEDLELIIGSPSKRRRYADTLLIQTHPEYRRSHASYEKALRIRNKLLKMIKDGVGVSSDEMAYWEEQLIAHGTIVHTYRKLYIAFLNAFSPSSEKSMAFYAGYDHSIVSRERFEKYHDVERAAGVTLIGPHRDDLVIYKGTSANEYTQLHQYGSRGEQRMGVLWMKLAELSYMTRKNDTQPILLLDDILSELDEGHRDLVFSIIQNQQTIITTATYDAIPRSISRTAHIIKLTITKQPDSIAE